ncbi:hypothetical protein ACO0LF_09200 [Undibacterium sp. Di27W]|uniref:hypothetical protein n=1 Tax=Undibacterium sp. Di27W TaxID=3413036 RepID=UPI003BF2EE49
MSWIKSIFLTLLLTVSLFEVLGIFIKPSEYFWNNRQLFLSKNSTRTIGDEGLWTYQPNSKVISAATYHFSPGINWLEYKCTFETNHFGLVDTNVKAGDKIDLLVLGDSFTEGQGGCPWLSKDKLQQANVTTKIVNGGLQGMGIQSFKYLSDWLETQTEIKNVMVIAISNDFKRRPIPTFWKASEPCMDHGNCNLRTDYWWPVDETSTDADIVKLGADRFNVNDRLTRQDISESLRYFSFSYNVISKYAGFLKKPNAALVDEQELFDLNFKALGALKQKYPQLKLILLTQRDETGLFGRKNADSIYVEDRLKRQQVNYTTCPLAISDFMRIDGHPNEQGYKKISACFFAQYQQKS